MKKTIITALFLSMATVNLSAQLLYRISGKELAAPSYIVGTYHLAPSTFADSIPGMRQAMADCQQTYGELVTSQMISADSTAMLQQAMMLPDDMTIDKVLSAEEMARLNDFMKKLMGIDLTNPLLKQQMGKMSPQGLNTTLTMLGFMKKEGNVNPNNLLDDYFQKEALAQGKGVGGLETIEFQIRVLFKGLTLERQKEGLMCLIDNADFMDEMGEKVRRAYYSKDIVALKEAMDAKLHNSCDSTPEEDAQLIDNRNADWVTKMPAIMSQKPTLFAVGAGHLPGPKGVLALLRTAGYQVEAVK